MQSGRRIKQGRFVCGFVSPAFRWFRRVLRNRTLVWHVKIPTAPLRKFKPQISPKVGNYRLSLPGSWFFAGLALCLKALLFLLEQLVEFDKKGAEFLRILLCGHLCRKLHQSFSLFALQMRFSSRPPPAPGDRRDTVSQRVHIQCVWYRTILRRCANLRATLAQSRCSGDWKIEYANCVPWP
jgi:hypothetical protein